MSVLQSHRDASGPILHQHHAKAVHEQNCGYLNLSTRAIFMQLLGEAKTPLNHDWHLASAQQWIHINTHLWYSALATASQYCLVCIRNLLGSLHV